MRVRRTVIILEVFLLLALVSFSQAEMLMLPSGLIAIEEEAFAGDTSLDLVVIPGKVESIGARAFAGSSVKEIELPASVQYIAEDALDAGSGVTVTAEEGTYAYLWAVQHGFIKIEGREAGSPAKVVVQESIPAGRDLTAMIFGPADAVRHTVYLIDEVTGESVYQTFTTRDATAVWKGYELNSASYRITVYTVTKEYKTLEPVVKHIQISGEKAAGPVVETPETLEYNGQAILENVSYAGMPSVMEATFVNADGERSQQIYQSAKGLSYCVGTFVDERGGTIEVRFAVKANNAWSAWSEARTIEVLPQYKIPIWNLNLPEQVEGGKDFRIQFLYDQNVTQMRAEIVSASGEYECYWHDDYSYGSGAADFSVPGYILDNGEYKVQVYCDTELGNNYQCVLDQTITVTGDRPAKRTLSIDASEVFTGDSYTLSFAADQIQDAMIREVYIGSLNNKNYVSAGTGGSKSFRKYSIIDESRGSDLYKYRLSVKVDGIWSEWGEEKELTLKKRAALANPVMEIPSTLAAGQDLDFSIIFPEEVGRFNAYLYYAYNSNAVRSFSGNAHQVELCVEGYRLNTGMYRLFATGYSDDGRECSVQKYFTVTGTKQSGPEVTYDSDLIRANKTVTFTADTAGADTLLIRHSMSRWSESIIEVDATGNQTQWSYPFSRYDAGNTMNISFAVKRNGAWSEWTTVSEQIQSMEPEYLDPAVLHANESYKGGEYIELSFDTVENASYYEWGLYRDDFLLQTGGSYGTDSYTCYGFDLGPGEYRYYVNAYDYYYYTYQSSYAEVTFTITDEWDPAPEVTPETEPLRIRNNATFIIDTEDAEEVILEYNIHTGDSYWDSNRIEIGVTDVQTFWQYYLDDYLEGATFDLSVRVKRNNQWTAWNRLSYVIQGLPTLDQAVLHANETYDAGKNFVLSFDAVPNATYYEWRLENADHQIYGGSGSEPSGLFCYGYDLEPGEYRFYVNAQAEGYSMSTAETTVTITGSKQAAPEVTVDKTTVYEYEDYHFAVQTSGAESLRYRLTWEDGSIYNTGVFSIEGAVTQCTFSRDFSLYHAFATFRNGAWSAWSEPILVTIQPRPILEQPAVTILNQGGAGADIEFSFEPVENAETYYARLYNGDQYNDYVWESWNVVPNEINHVPGYTINSGSFYTLHVESQASVWQPGIATRTIETATGEREEGPAVTSEKEILRIRDTASFIIDTTDTEKLNLRYRFHTADSDWGTNWSEPEVTGAETVWQYYLEEQFEGGTLDLSVMAYRNGRWTNWSYYSYEIQGLPLLEPAVLNVNETYEAGTNFVLSFDPVENATSYNWEFYDPYGNGSSNTVSAPEPYYCYGYTWEPGEYQYRVTARSDDYKASVSEIVFHITGEKTAAPAVTVDHSSVERHESFTFTIQAESPEMIRYRAERDNGEYWYTWSEYEINAFEDVTTWSTSCYDPANYRYQFCTLKDGKWSAWSEPIVIAVVLPTPLDPPDFSVSADQISRYQDLEVTVQPVENATYYSIALQNQDGFMVMSRSLDDPDGGTITFRGYNGFPSGQMQVCVTAGNSRTSSDKATAYVEVTDITRPSAPAVTPPAKTTVAPYEDFSFSIDTQNADLVAVRRYPAGNTNEVTYDLIEAGGNGTTDWTTELYNAGSIYSYAFSVRVNGIWSAWSSTMQIIVE